MRVQQPLPAAVAGTVQRAGGLVAQRRAGAQAGPAIGQVFDDAQLLSRAQPADHGGSGQVRAGVSGDLDPPGNLDLVFHPCGHHQRAGSGAVHEKCTPLGAFVLDGL